MWIRKVFKQSGSVAVVVPKALCEVLGIGAGSHLTWTLQKDESVRVEKLDVKGGKGGRKGSGRSTV